MVASPAESMGCAVSCEQHQRILACLSLQKRSPHPFFPTSDYKRKISFESKVIALLIQCPFPDETRYLVYTGLGQSLLRLSSKAKHCFTVQQ